VTSPQVPLPPLASPDDVATCLGVAGGATALPQTFQTRMLPTLRRVSRRFRLEAQRQFTPGTYTHHFKIQAGAVRLQEIPTSIDRVHIHGLILPTEFAFPTVQLTLERDELGLAENFNTPSGRSELTQVPPDMLAPLPPAPEDLADVEDFNKPGAVGISANRAILRRPSTQPRPHHHVVDNWVLWPGWDYWRLNGREVEITYTWQIPVPQDVVDCVATIVGRILTVDPMGALYQSKLLMSRHYRQELADWVSDGNTGFTQDDLCVAHSYRWPAPPMIIASMRTHDYSPSAAFLSDSSW
jgi:hypothetical protein